MRNVKYFDTREGLAGNNTFSLLVSSQWAMFCE
jgi:hypothetical protein